MNNLDGLDRQILDLLSQDARISHREIARTLSISHGNVSGRIQRLEKDGVIKGYTVLLDPDTLQKYVFCLQISVKPQSNLKKICPKIADFSDVSIIMRVSGDCDLLVLAICEHQKGALDLISKISEIQGIEKVESHIVLETIKMTAKWFKVENP